MPVVVLDEEEHAARSPAGPQTGELRSGEQIDGVLRDRRQGDGPQRGTAWAGA